MLTSRYKSLNIIAALAFAMTLQACGKKEEPPPPPPPAAAAPAPKPAVSDEDISDAYLYLMGRALIVRQEILDFKGSEKTAAFKWNEVQHHKPGGVAWANPNLDVAYSEAWLALDEKTPVILEIPEIKGGRYYTWQMLNGWGETLLNINERTFKDKPFGKYALVLKGSTAEIPADAFKVELPAKKVRVLARIELGKDPKEAIRLQNAIKLTPTGEVQVDPAPDMPLFDNDKFPGAELFDVAAALTSTAEDINEGMAPLQDKVKAVTELVASGPEGKARVDEVIKTKAGPRFKERFEHLGRNGNGWTSPTGAGNYKDDYVLRTAIDLGGIWANNSGEVVYYKTGADKDGQKLNGDNNYQITFPADALPISKVKYFWSVIAVDSTKFQVLPNPKKRYLLNKESGVKAAKDGSVTLYFGDKKPAGVPDQNWLPTPKGTDYDLTFRFYGPTDDLIEGKYFPPELTKQ